MSDLISRQAALDAISDDKIDEKSFVIIRGEFGSENEVKTFNMACDRHEEFIKEIPSAQPELDTGLYTDGYNDGYRDGVKDAQPEPKWIPCSERLPEEDGPYLVTYNSGATVYPECDIYDVCCYEISDGWEHTHIVADCTILAWMPLPEPWRGEEKGWIK